MKRKFLFYYVKELIKLKYKFFCSFALQCFVDEIFQFEFFVLSANTSHFAQLVAVKYQFFMSLMSKILEILA